MLSGECHNTSMIISQHSMVQVMAWCHQATSHYLGQCWPRSMSYGVTRPQWVRFILKNFNFEFGFTVCCDHWLSKVGSTQYFDYFEVIEFIFDKAHENVMTCKHFPHYWTLWGNPFVTNGFPSQRACNAERWCIVFFVISMNKLLNYQSSCQLLELPWGSHHVTIMSCLYVWCC